MNDNRKGGGGNVDDDNSFDEVIIGGRNAVLKVERDDNFAIQSNVNRWLKYGIFSLSYLFLLFSIGLFALGIWAQMAKSGVLVDLKKFDSKNVVLFLEPTALITVIAIIIVIISFCGAIGSLRDNCFYLMVYECMLGCLIITYLMLIVTTIFNGFVLLRVIEITIEDIIILYRDEPDLQLLVDWIQINFKCCGVHSPHDWNNNIYFSFEISAISACWTHMAHLKLAVYHFHAVKERRQQPPHLRTRIVA
ncbi:unnamed protein product [Litomosoides sigmodontis]|uniref:Uncharacterized protein n=1 Tax=Litomosoides sigmodontis TaxID=42156 RepID=A0A3P6T428_LITSI|nr:unnamed protein product [Litomosoides sigmodontis]